MLTTLCHHEVSEHPEAVTSVGSETSFVLPAYLPYTLRTRAAEDERQAAHFGVARFDTENAAHAGAKALNRGGLLPADLVHGSIATYYWLKAARTCRKAGRGADACLVSSLSSKIQEAGGIRACLAHGTIHPGSRVCRVCEQEGERLTDTALPHPDLSAWDGVDISHPLPPVWVGNDYPLGGQFRKRVLVISESTYGAPQSVAHFHNLLMAHDHIANDYRDQHRQRLSAAFIGGKDMPNLEQKARFWQSVAYLNYVLGVQEDSGMAPTDWTGQPVGTWIEYLKPSVVVLTNFRMWDRKGNKAILEWDFDEGDVPLSSKKPRHSRSYQSPTGHQFLACAIKQPAFCSRSVENAVLTNALAAAPDHHPR